MMKNYNTIWILVENGNFIKWILFENRGFIKWILVENRGFIKFLKRLGTSGFFFHFILFK